MIAEKWPSRAGCDAVQRCAALLDVLSYIHRLLLLLPIALFSHRIPCLFVLPHYVSV